MTHVIIEWAQSNILVFTYSNVLASWLLLSERSSLAPIKVIATSYVPSVGTCNK